MDARLKMGRFLIRVTDVWVYNTVVRRHKYKEKIPTRSINAAPGSGTVAVALALEPVPAVWPKWACHTS